MFQQYALFFDRFRVIALDAFSNLAIGIVGAVKVKQNIEAGYGVHRVYIKDAAESGASRSSLLLSGSSISRRRLTCAG